MIVTCVCGSSSKFQSQTIYVESVKLATFQSWKSISKDTWHLVMTSKDLIIRLSLQNNTWKF